MPDKIVNTPGLTWVGGKRSPDALDEVSRKNLSANPKPKQDFSLHGHNLLGEPCYVPAACKLADDFIIPPFSVLDARQGYWQDRKRAWLATGIQSELGQGEQLIPNGQEMTSKLRYDASPGGRGTGSGQPIPSTSANKRSLGRSTGQDLMRGEYTVGAKTAVSQKLAPGGCWIGGPKTDSTEKFNKANLKTSPAPKGLTWSGASASFDYYRVIEGSRETTQQSGTSIFDPVLCELAYRWFCPQGGQIIDPFAGGSVRGIVASLLKYRYWGCDLGAAQIAANYQQAATICPDAKLQWIVGDSMEHLPKAPAADMIFSCPPYGSLERYSEDPRDLSTMDYPAFVRAYWKIIALACSRLRNNRFACIVVGNYRDSKTGHYRNFVGQTIAAFAKCGLALYNDAILVTVVGSLPIRVGKQFTTGRKLGRTHQSFLCFIKGSWKEAVKACGDLDF
jgi:hypothetical protein